MYFLVDSMPFFTDDCPFYDGGDCICGVQKHECEYFTPSQDGDKWSRNPNDCPWLTTPDDRGYITITDD